MIPVPASHRAWAARLLASYALLTRALAACGDATPPPPSGEPREVDAQPGATPGGSDAGAADGGASTAVDAGDEPRSDPEVEPGKGLVPEIMPGSHVQVPEARLQLGDTFAATRMRLGPGTRSALANTRSYDWALSEGTSVSIWFANSNLDNDDAAPGDVDDQDQILWISAKGAFPAETDRGIGLGATRTEVEAPSGYGPPDAVVAAEDGPGRVAQYFTAGVFVTYDAADRVRALTISRLYRRAPDGAIDLAAAALDFGAAGRLTGLRTSPRFVTGTPEGDLRALLGEPDARGEVMNGSQRLRVFSYGFIGLEVFFLGDRDTVAFWAIHAPYFGQTSGGSGVGSTRLALEAELGLGPGERASNPQLVCYPNRRAPRLGVSYGADDRVTSLTAPLLLCP